MKDTSWTKGRPSHGGKGSAPRPISNLDKFDEAWDLIFNKYDEGADDSNNETAERQVSNKTGR